MGLDTVEVLNAGGQVGVAERGLRGGQNTADPGEVVEVGMSVFVGREG